MRYLVTGAAGFIGSNAVTRIKQRGDQVVGVDNMSRAGSAANARWLTEEHGVTIQRLDLRHADAVAACVAEVRPDVVFHCAGQVAVTTSVSNPRGDFLDNAVGTFNVLEAVRLAAPEAIFLYTSTNKVYGKMEAVGIELHQGRYRYTDLPNGCDEERPLDLHSPYGCSKGAADQYVHDYARIYGMRTVVFRQSCVYGYRQFGVEDQGWVAWFGIRAALGQSVTIFGDGRQVRDVLFIDDLIDAFLAAVAHIDGVAGHVYNIGGGPANQMSLLDLVGELERLSGRPLRVEYAGWRPGDQRVFVCDIRRAGRELGWSPRVAAPEGIGRLYRWIDANRAVLTEIR